MSAAVRFRVTLAVFSAAALGAAALGQSGADLRVRRVDLPPGTDLAALLKTEGALVEVPWPSLQKRLAAFERASDAVRTPRVVKASYRARIQGTSLVAGGGEWRVENPGPGPAPLYLTACNLAIRRARLDGQDAVLGDLDGKRLGLWLEREGLATCDFEWSLRGTPSAAGTTFDLRVPPCAATTLEIQASADQTVSAPRGAALVTGPHESESPTTRVWRVHLAGRSQVELLVRRGTEPGRLPVVFAGCETRLAFAPDATACEWDFQVEAVQAPVRELTFDVDAGWEILEATARPAQVTSWRVEPGPSRGKKERAVHTLRVQFREPLLGAATVHLHASGPRWPESDASVPTAVLRDAIARGETVRLSLPAEQQFERWDAGGFRLVAAEGTSDRTQTLIDPRTDGKSARPSFGLRAPTVEFGVRQDSVWTLTENGAALTSEAKVDVSRGRLYGLQLRLPKGPGWQVANVDVVPRDALQGWGVAGNVLHVDLQQGATPRTDLALTVNLRGPKPSPGDTLVDFPDLEPLGAKTRQGTLTIFVDERRHATLGPGAPAPTTPDASVALDPRFRFAFAHGSAPLAGKLRLRPASSAEAASIRFDQRVTATFDRSELDAKLALAPTSAATDTLDLRLTRDAPFTITAPAGAVSQERLPAIELRPWLALLGARDPFRATALATSAPRGAAWRLRFAVPLAPGATVAIRQSIPEEADAPHAVRELPLASLLAGETVGAVSLRAVDVESTMLPVRGLDPIGGGVYRLRGPTPSLSAKIAPRRTGNASASIDAVEWTTTIAPDGAVEHRLRFALAHWPREEFPVRTPADWQPIAGAVEGRDLARATSTPNGPDGAVATFTLAGPDEKRTVELTFRSTRAARFGVVDAGDVPPQLPVEPWTWRRRVLAAPRWAPLDRRVVGTPGADEVDPASTLWNAGADWFAPVGVAMPAWWSEGRLAAHACEDAVRAKLNVDATWAEALARLVLEGETAKVRWVVDRQAFADAGIGPSAPTTRETGKRLWDAAGLDLIVTPHATILGCRRALALGAARDDGPALGLRLADAVASALASGRDATGRFVAADAWLTSESAAGPPRGPGRFAADAREWRPAAGSLTVGRFVRHGTLRAGGVAAATLILALAWALRRAGSAAALRTMLAILAALCAAYAPAPHALRGPIVGAGAAAFVGLAVALTRRAPVDAVTEPRAARSTQKAMRAALGAIALATLGSAALPTRSQEPAERVVYVLDSRAFLAPDTLRWLEERERGDVGKLDEVVVRAARYVGRLEGDVAVFDAEFDLHAFRDDDAFLVPLVGVDLREGCFLDGTPAYPSAREGGFALPVRGVGAHRLSLRFAVRAPAGEAKFSGPATPDASLAFRMPAASGAPRLVRGFGAESVKTDAKTGAATLDASLGRDAQVHVAWTTSGPAAPSAPTQIREMHYWDLRLSQRTAAVVLECRATAEIDHLELLLPPGVEVRSADALDVAGKPAPALAGWRTTAKDPLRTLRVEFLRPFAGEFALGVGLVPSPSGPAHEIRLPLPLRASLVSSKVAFRLDAVDWTEQKRFVGAAETSADAFAKEWGRLSPREAAPTRAYSFVRAAKNAASAALDIVPVPPARRVDAQFDAAIQPHGVSIVGRYSVRPADVPLVTLKAPAGFEVRDVQGTDVHHWSRTDDLVHVWLTGARAKADFVLVGGVNQPLAKAKQATLPLPAPVGAATSERLVRATAAGFDVAPLDPGWKREADGAGTYRVPPGAVSGTFTLTPRAPTPLWRVLREASFAGEGDAVVRLVGVCESAVWPELRLRGVGLADRDARLNASAAVQTAVKRDGADLVWTVTLAAGSPQQVRLALLVPLPRGEGATVPEVRIEKGGTIVGEWAALVGASLAKSDAKQAWVAERQPTTALAAWAGDVARLRGAGAGFWRREGDAGSLKAAPTKANAASAVRSLLARQTAELASDGRWLHRATWLVAGPAGAVADLRLPPGAEPHAVFVDGEPLPEFDQREPRMRVTLPGGGPLTRIDALWRVALERESRERPDQTAATLGDAATAPRVVLAVPPGWTLVGDAPAPTRLDPLRARVRTLASLPDDDVAAAEPLVRSAGLLARFAKATLAGEPELSDLDASLRRSTARFGLDAALRAAERRPWKMALPLADEWPIAGEPHRANGPTPDLRAAPTIPPAERTLRTRAAFLAVAFLALFALALRRSGAALVAALWPEWTIAGASVAVALAGMTPLAGALFSVAAVGRGVALARCFTRWRRSRAAPDFAGV